MKIARIAFVVTAAVASVAFTRCNPVYEITFTLTDAAASRAFGCATDAGTLIEQRLVPAQSAAIVIDVIDLGKDIHSCRTSALIDFCGPSGNCTRLRRSCYSLDLKAFDGGTLLDQSFAQIRAQDAGIADLPTDETLMIRVVATAETDCPKGGLDPTQIAGCAYSCPTRLDTSGSIDLDLDVPAYVQCEQAVVACATFGAP